MKRFIFICVVAALFFGANYALAQVYKKVVSEPTTFAGIVTFQQQILTKNGSSASNSIGPSNDPNDGIHFGTNAMFWNVNSGAYIMFGTNLNTRSSVCYQWSSGNDPSASTDTRICRDRAGVVKVQNVLQLAPMASAPANPVQGDIYVDSTNGELCFYDGSAWQGISTGTDGNCS